MIPATRRAFRAAAGVFAAGAVFTALLFARALGEREIRSGLFTYAAMCIAVAIGLWRVRRWGRSLGLIVSVGNAGLGALALMSVLFARRGPMVAPAILLAIGVAMAVWLSRPVFALPEDTT